MSKRLVTESVKKSVAGKQNYKCSNSLNSQIINNFICPLYDNPKRNGTFGEEGYEIDHLIELCNGGSNEIENLQALCLSCHRVKTKRLLQEKKEEKKEDKKEIKKKEKLEEKKEVKLKNDSRLDLTDFVKEFNLEDELYIFNNSLTHENRFKKIEKGIKYNILKQDICIIKSINWKRLYSDKMIEYFFGNFHYFMSDNKGYMNAGKLKTKYSNINEDEVIHLGDFIHYLNTTFPDKVNVKKYVLTL